MSIPVYACVCGHTRVCECVHSCMYMCVLCMYMCVYTGVRTHMLMLVCLLHVLCGHVSVRGCAWTHMCVLLTLWGGR